MTLKKMVYINTIITFLLCFIAHGMYSWIPSNAVAVFFPVNESIWEHMKMLYTSILIYGFIEHLLLIKLKYHSLFICNIYSYKV